MTSPNTTATNGAAAPTTGGDRATAPHASSSGDVLERVELAVGGMTCGACAAQIERALGKRPEVADVRVSPILGRASLLVRAGTLSVPEIIAAIVALGFEARADEPAERGSPSLVATLPQNGEGNLHLATRATIALVLGALAMGGGMQLAERYPISMQLALSLTTLCAFAMAWRPVVRPGLRQLRHGGGTMDSLIALGAIAAVVASVPGYWGHVHGAGTHAMGYYDTAIFILGFALVGRALDARAREHATQGLRTAFGEAASYVVVVLPSGEAAKIAAGSVVPGDVLQVAVGEAVAADGVLASPGALLDMAHVSGESEPVAVRCGDEVLAGSLNRVSAIRVTVTKAVRDSRTATLATLFREMQAARSPLEQFAQRATGYVVPAILGLTAVTGAGWYLTAHDARLAFARALAVLVVACPCALGLAIPVAAAVATGRAARLGILVRGSEALLRFAAVSTLAFDKTGTMTVGRPRVVAEWFAPGAATARELARALAEASDHPLSVALQTKMHDAPKIDLVDILVEPGIGVRARAEGEPVALGGEALLAQAGIVAPEAQWRVAGIPMHGARVCVLRAGQLVAAFALEDVARPEAKAVVATLSARGYQLAMASGDRAAEVSRVAGALGMTRVLAGATPESKIAFIRQLRAEGRGVAMIGDGLNDAPVMAAANAAIAMAGGTGLAKSAADAILLRDDLTLVPKLLALSRAAERVMKQNLAWVVLYNLVALPLAAGLLTRLGSSCRQPSQA